MKDTIYSREQYLRKKAAEKQTELYYWEKFLNYLKRVIQQHK